MQVARDNWKRVHCNELALPQFIYDGLIPGTEHNFSVTAVNNLGDGVCGDGMVDLQEFKTGIAVINPPISAMPHLIINIP